MAAEAAMRAGAGYVTACVPGALMPVFEARLLEAMAAALRRRRCARARGVRAAPGQRAASLVLGPGIGRQRDAEDLRARAGAPAPRSRWSSTPTGSTLTPGRLEDLRVPARSDGPHAARGRARPPAGMRGRRDPAPAAAPRPRGRRALGRDRRPQGRRHARRRARRVAWRVNPGRHARRLPRRAPATCSPACSAPCWPRASTPFAAACAAVAPARRAGRLAADRVGVEGVIASDVIAALPAARGG